MVVWEGYKPVNIEIWEGNVQVVLETQFSKKKDSFANFDINGVKVPFPLILTRSALNVSKTMKMILGEVNIREDVFLSIDRTHLINFFGYLQSYCY